MFFVWSTADFIGAGGDPNGFNDGDSIGDCPCSSQLLEVAAELFVLGLGRRDLDPRVGGDSASDARSGS
jgi:hypothetical protein